MKKLMKVLVLIPCLLFLVNCSKSSKNSGTNNNQCYTNYNQQGQYNNGSTYYNPNCNSPTGGAYPTGGQVCQGTYWYQGQPVWCEAQACSGWTLQMNSTGPQSAPTQPGQTVRCM